MNEVKQPMPDLTEAQWAAIRNVSPVFAENPLLYQVRYESKGQISNVTSISQAKAGKRKTANNRGGKR
jgi:hypothetical protein